MASSVLLQLFIYSFRIVYGNTGAYRTHLNNVFFRKTEHWKGQQNERSTGFVRMGLTFLRILNIESVH